MWKHDAGSRNISEEPYSLFFKESVDKDSYVLLTVCVISQLPHGDDAVGGGGGQKGSGVGQGHAVEIWEECAKHM